MTPSPIAKLMDTTELGAPATRVALLVGGGVVSLLFALRVLG